MIIMEVEKPLKGCVSSCIHAFQISPFSVRTREQSVSQKDKKYMSNSIVDNQVLSRFIVKSQQNVQLILTDYLGCSVASLSFSVDSKNIFSRFSVGSQ